jgi:hypothetical protein
MGRWLRGRDDGANVNNVQCKSNWNCHYKSPLLMNIAQENYNKKEKIEKLKQAL